MGVTGAILLALVRIERPWWQQGVRYKWKKMSAEKMPTKNPSEPFGMTQINKIGRKQKKKEGGQNPLSS